MPLHESSVNFQNLIRDLAEMYPFDIADVVVVELVANSLDAKATKISIEYSPQKKVLVVQDNGKGMSVSEFDEYHDFAAGLKTRGTGIGFAGLGAKVSFNIADRVITETKSKSFSSGSNWSLQSKKKLLWEDIKPINLEQQGTRVEVHFKPDVIASYGSTETIIKLLQRHFMPLFDSKLLELYERLNLYSRNIRFIANSQVVQPGRLTESFNLTGIREFFPERKDKLFGYGYFGVSESEYPVASDVCGVMLCTYGKVIKADLFNQFPGSVGTKIFGIVEVPEFVKYLTTSKTDFIKRKNFREFERLYDPIRKEFKDWLTTIGIESPEISSTDESLELEKEIKKLVEDVPELSEFFGFWHRKNILKKDYKGDIPSIEKEGISSTFPIGEGKKADGQGIYDEGDIAGKTNVEDKEGNTNASPISRKARGGPKIAFIDAPDRIDLGWIEGNNIVINSGHPSYIKVSSNPKTRKIHSLFTIADVIQRYKGAEGINPDLMFIDRMMSVWGQK